MKFESIAAVGNKENRVTVGAINLYTLLTLLSILFLIVVALKYIISQLVRSDTEFAPLYSRVFGIRFFTYPISGTVAPGYKSVLNLFKYHFERGSEVGCSVAVYSYGKLVVDLNGGFADYSNGKPYTSDTLNLMMSCSKFMSSFAIAYLVDNGYLKYDTKVSDIWPEFSAGNKGDVRVHDVLQHQFGLHYFLEPQPNVDILFDENKLAEYIAGHPHLFEGSKIRGYSSNTRGWILNEICRRVHPNNYNLRQLFISILNLKLDIEYYIGLNDEKPLLERKATFYHYPWLDKALPYLLPDRMLGERCSHAMNNNLKKAMKNKDHLYMMTKQQLSKNKSYLKYHNELDFVNAAIPSLAKVASIFANDGKLNDEQILSKGTVDLVLSDISVKPDIIMGKSSSWSLGGLLVHNFPKIFEPIKSIPPSLPFSDSNANPEWKDISTNLFGNNTAQFGPFYAMAGAGGSLVAFHPKFKFAFAYLMNTTKLGFLTKGNGFDLLKVAFHNHCQKHGLNLEQKC